MSAAKAVSDFAPVRLRYASSVMPVCLDHLNVRLQANCLVGRNDVIAAAQYHRGMAQPHHDWYLKEWLRTLGKKQADLARDLDMNKAKVSLTASGKQPYDRDDINAISAYLHLRPYELLMHPDDAMTLRRLRETAVRIAAENKADAEEAGIDLSAEVEPLKKFS